MLAKTGHDFHVITKLGKREFAWGSSEPPVPENITLIEFNDEQKRKVKIGFGELRPDMEMSVIFAQIGPRTWVGTCSVCESKVSPCKGPRTEAELCTRQCRLGNPRSIGANRAPLGEH